MKQAKSKSWYAVGASGMLGLRGAVKWFRTIEDARRAVNEFAVGKSDWQLISR